MIIKSLTRKDTQSYKQLISYITQEAKVGKSDALFFSYNVESTAPEEVAEEMQENYTHRKRVRADENALMHYVLSFHKGDTVVLEKEVLADIVNEFMEEFSPNGMGYGAVHSDQEHLHCHMVLTANELESNQLIYKKRYLNKIQKERSIEERNYKERTFEESKNRVRHYARERAKQYAQQKELAAEYQQYGLYHSFDERLLKKERDGRAKRKDRLDNQRRKNGRGTKHQKKRTGRILQILSSDAIDALNNATNFNGFARNLQEKGYTLYRTKRGTINGILYEGKKYRFTTTLLPSESRIEFNAMRRQHQDISEQYERRSRYRERGQFRGRGR